MLPADTLAKIYCSNMPHKFCPLYIGQEFVLKLALRDPVRAVEISAALIENHNYAPSTFAIALASYRRNPEMWRRVSRLQWETRHRIDNCERGKPLAYLP